jgi:excisionase family DNA binding protein
MKRLKPGALLRRVKVKSKKQTGAADATTANTGAPAPLSGAFARKELLSVSEFCEAVSIGKTRAFELMSAGAVESVKIGASRRITRRSVESWLARLPRAGGAS